jgi:hypothetical protein
VASLADDLPVLVESDEAEAPRRRLVRLAFDVHDGPLQSLTAAGYSIHELQRRLAAEESSIPRRCRSSWSRS